MGKTQWFNKQICERRHEQLEREHTWRLEAEELGQDIAMKFSNKRTTKNGDARGEKWEGN
jgi:hypothetical protein